MRADAEEIEIIRERTRQGLYELDLGEIQWRDKAELLLQHGYRLRPRLMPGWTPSWEGTDLFPEYCEDSVRTSTVTAVDATRISDGTRVMIKRTSPLTSETAALRFLNSTSLKDDPSNHCVPLLDAFPDNETNMTFVVTPLLREFYEPPFCTVKEAVEFLKQTLKGINFMHNSGVAHLDCTANNIMMDGSTMFPKGFHPVRKRVNIDGFSRAKYISRTKAKSVKYYYIDFGMSKLIRSEIDRRMDIKQGAAKLPPEIERGEVYDPLPVDLYYLGHVYRENLLEPYANMEFLRPLIEALIQQDPKARPSAPQALSQFEKLVSARRGYSLRWRLRKRNEGLWSRNIRDIGSIGQEALFIVSAIATSPIRAVQSVIGAFRRRRKQSIELPDE
ncbi:hypothetical protein SCHPADRAFT_821640 [Schizopora paradoxa]|uniref:Protein kinase domain-containing protein n=1 Tax=Schizopora paradoxa TaxID=27342 RepID=A0A0H2SJJ4_9AGAM|nr:hypothetical protein SCHPADRAFT_821640 [Schizopora paradoxa]